MKKHLLVSAAVAIGLLGSASVMAAAPDKTPPGTEVVDSRGAVVGNLAVGQGLTERQINGVWYAFFLASRDGLFVFPTNALTIYYTSTNCTGTAYLDARSLPPIVFLTNPNFPDGGGPVNSATMDYPAAPFQALPISSFSNGNGNSCQLLSPPTTMTVGLVTTTTLTVVPPLSVR